MKHYLLCVLLLLAVSTQAQGLKGLLNKAKNAVEEKVSEKISTKKENSSKQASAGTEKSTSSARSSQSKVLDDMSEFYFNGEEVHPFLKNLPTSNFHSGYDRNFPSEPTVAAGAATLNVDGDINYFSPFSEGVAYCSSYESGNFFFDKKGNILFTTEMDVSDDEIAPRLNNGVVMEVPEPHKTTGTCRIRDKKGNVVKEFSNCANATNFVNGIAALQFRKKDSEHLTYDEIKYVDTKGNYVFPNLTIKSYNVFRMLDPFDIRHLVREEHEGLTAYCVIAEQSGDRSWGYRDGTGKVVIPAQYAEVGDFYEGLAAVMVNPEGGGQGAKGRWGYIDKTGKMVIQPRYSVMPTRFNSGLAMVADREGKTYYIDKTGTVKLGPVGMVDEENAKNGDICAISPFVDGYAFVQFVIVHPVYGTLNTFSGVIDPSFKLQSWGMNVSGSRRGYLNVDEFEGKHYLKGEGYNDIYWVKTPEMKRPVNYVKSYYHDGLSLYRSTNQGGHSGYMDESGQIVLEIKKNSF